MNKRHLWAESQGIVGVQVGIAGPQGSTTRLVKGVGICIGAVSFQVAIELDTGTRAGGRGVVGA